MSKEESKPPIELDNIILSDSKVVCNNYRDPECFMIGVGWGTAKTFLYYESKLSELRKENEELHQSEILWFDRNADLESQLSESKERIEFLEMQLRHLKENKNTDAPF